MIGPKLRQGLTVAAWVLIAFSPLLALVTLYEIVTGEQFAHANWVGRIGLTLVVGLLSPAIQGGILLVLLSIDERIQNRGS